MGFKKDPEPTTDVYVSTIMERAICNKHVGKHSGGPGGPCWSIMLDNGDISRGVCNKRATEAGFVGRISPQSLSRVNGAPRFAKKK